MNIQHFDDKALLFMHTDHINLLALLLFFFFFSTARLLQRSVHAAVTGEAENINV